MRLALFILFVLSIVGCAEAPEPNSSPPSSPPAALVEVTEAPAEREPPAPAQAPAPDELLIIGATACPDRNRWHGTRGDCVQSFTALYHQGAGQPWRRCDSVTVATPLHRLLLRGEVTVEVETPEQLAARRGPGWLSPPVPTTRCAMATLAETLLGTEHDIYPLSRTNFWDVNLDATLEEHHERLGVAGDGWPRGVHARVGGVSGIVNTASRWLDGLEGRAAVVGRATMEIAEVKALAEEAYAAAADGEGPVDRIGRQELFSPEIPDRALRVAIARMPVLYLPQGVSAFAFEGVGDGAGPRFLLTTIGNSVPGTFWAGFHRGAVRYRVLEEGARPVGLVEAS